MPNVTLVCDDDITICYSEPTWLFCGTNDGVVSLWDVGLPTLPTYDGVNPKQLLKLFPDYGDVYNIAWSGHESNWLLAGTAAGLVRRILIVIKQSNPYFCLGKEPRFSMKGT